jgi:hypothetical protein
MKKTREQQKAELMKKYEAELDQILEWQEKADYPNLTQFENEILAMRKRNGIEVMKTLLQGEQSSTPVEIPKCPKCGQGMETQGKRPKVIETRIGTLHVEREYYYCQNCQEGIFPPG